MTPRDYINIPIETLCVLICVVLLTFQLADKNKKKESNKWYGNIIIANILMLLGDLSDLVIGGMPGVVIHYLQIIFSLVLYYSAGGYMLYSMMRWVMCYISQYVKISKNWIRISHILMIMQVVFASTMQLTRICYVDANNIYHRSDYFYFTQFLPFIIYAMVLFNLLRYIKLFKFHERIYLGLFCLIPLIGIIIQNFNEQLLLLNVASTFGLILCTIFIQLQREMDMEEEIRELISNENVKLEDIKERQETLNSQIIDVFNASIEAKDSYTRGHSQRVAQYAREIMYRLGGDEQMQLTVYSAGILHDVGKLNIPDEIVSKKGKLTEEEYEQVKLHTVVGYQILKGVELVPELAMAAKWHHERYDGKGYPSGLSGENIPLVARIIAVADAYEAMTSSRNYHAIMPQSEVREQISKGMGTQFDPKIAQIMLDMIDDDLQYEMRQTNCNKITQILMIDDDKFMHDMAESVIDYENCVLTCAQSGEEGIKLFGENKFDLCLLDMEMPGMNGFEVLDWIHKNTRGVRVIIVTGDKDMDSIRKTQEMGATDYITKPVNCNILRETINSVLTH